MKNRIKPILVGPHHTIREVMTVIKDAPHAKPEPAPSGIAVVVDKNGRLLGIATDGDIRRAILKNISIDEKVSQIMRKDPITVRSSIPMTDMIREIIDRVKNRNIVDKKIEKVVIVDDEDKISDVVSFFDLWRSSEVQTRNICVVGLGYVGLTLALTLADVGFDVAGVDMNKKIIASLKASKPHFHEVGLEPLLKYHTGKNFNAFSDLKHAQSDVYIIAVNTPVDKKGKVIMDYLRGALTEVSKVLKPHDLVILRSTVPMGTCRNVAAPILEKGSGLKAGNEFYLAFAPERTIEGKALEELRTLPQIIGGINKTSVDLTAKLFKSITGVIVPVSGLEVAEMVKLLNNTFRDLSFAYANEVAQICDRFSVNSFEVIGAANNGYPRNKIPTPSPGVGGACLTKDPYILTESARKAGFSPKLMVAGRKINDSMIDYVANRVNKFFGGAKNKKIFVMGVAFKGYPETSDIRFSTAVDVINKLKDKHNVCVYDAVVSKGALKKNNLRAVSVKEGFKDADCILVLNNHPSFKELDIYDLLKRMKNPGLFFDGWNMFAEDTFKNISGVAYATFGK